MGGIDKWMVHKLVWSCETIIIIEFQVQATRLVSMKWLPKSQTNTLRLTTTKYQAVTVEHAVNNGTAAASYWMKVLKSGVGDRKCLLYKKLHAEWPALFIYSKVVANA